MIRVVAVDLDGTLLRSDGTVSPRSAKALAQAGLRTVIVTARPPRFVEMLAREAGLGGLAICSNGAVVYDLDSRHTEIVGPLSIRTARAAADATAEVLPSAAFALETGWRAIHGPHYGHIASRETSTSQAETIEELWASAESCVKLLAWTPAAVTDAMLASVGAALPADAEVTYSGAKGMLEIHAAGVSKVVTLARLCDDWGVSPAEVAAFGDMPNDLPVLRWAGRSVAMANAHPQVLAAASEFTASNDDDGVAIVLECMMS
jgi:Cof subfamily protein (haloacid dehalogenase superfamily)